MKESTRRTMRRLGRTVVVAATVACTIAAGARQPPQLPRIAILDFTNGTVTGGTETDVLKQVLAITLSGALVRSGKVQILERQRLAAVLAEQELGAGGRVDETTASRMGKILGADHMLMGTYIVQPDREMIVTTRLVNVATGEVSVAPEVIGDSRAMTGLMTRLAQQVAATLKLPAPANAPKPDNSRIRPQLVPLLNALARACDKRDSASVQQVRTEIATISAAHPALDAPCL